MLFIRVACYTLKYATNMHIIFSAAVFGAFSHKMRVIFWCGAALSVANTCSLWSLNWQLLKVRPCNFR